jgi:hypothetical protein
LKELNATSNEKSATVEVQRVQGSHTRFELLVATRKGLPTGPIAFDVDLRPISVEWGKLPTRTLRVEGLILEDIQAFPSVLHFGSRPLGETAVEVVTLSSLTNQPFEIESADTDCPDITFEPLKPTRSGLKAFRIKQLIRNLEDHFAQVSFKLRLQPRETRHLAVSVQYYGIRTQ